MNAEEKITEFLDRACFLLPTKRLKVRTRRELREHIEDGIELHSESGLTKEEAVERTLKEIGDPSKINHELRKAHKGLLWLARFRNAVTAVLIILVIAAFPAEIKSFSGGSPLKKAEAEISELEGFFRNESPELSFLYEYKNEKGKVYRVYVTNIGNTYLTESVRIFGKYMPNRFEHKLLRADDCSGSFAACPFPADGEPFYIGIRYPSEEKKFVRATYIVRENDEEKYEEVEYIAVPDKPCVLEVPRTRLKGRKAYQLKLIDFCSEKKETTEASIYNISSIGTGRDFYEYTNAESVL